MFGDEIAGCWHGEARGFVFVLYLKDNFEKLYVPTKIFSIRSQEYRG